MLIFVDPSGNYPRFIGDLMAATPDWSDGDQFPEGWQVVEETPLPPALPTQKVTEVSPTLVDGVLKQTWVVSDLTTEELERSNAAQTGRQKLKDVAGLTDDEIDALIRGLR